MTMEQQKSVSEKRPYNPPAVQRIELVADEVLSTGCKTLSAGPFGADCLAVPCNQMGS